MGGGSGWGTHVNPWLIHVSVWQKPLQYCKVISLRLIKINGKENELNCSISLENELKCKLDCKMIPIQNKESYWCYG